jgi:hypothetical protein
MDLGQKVWESARPHSGNTSAIMSALPLFRMEGRKWRMVCREDALFQLLPGQIRHRTVEDAPRFAGAVLKH